MGVITQKNRQARRLAAAACAAGALAGSLAAGAAGPAAAASPPAAGVKWTRISTGTGLGIASAGLLRTSDGRLHVVWPRDDGTTYSLHYSTVGPHSKVLATGTILRNWSAVSAYPRLVPGPGGGIRLVFTGGNGQNTSPYDLGAMYTATSGKSGTQWTLASGSMSQSKLIPLTDTAAATERDGTAVAAWPDGPELGYHVGVDPAIPATAPDSTVSISPGYALAGTALARDSRGQVWAAWYSFSNGNDRGYWVDRILPGRHGKEKAPHSGSKASADNEPYRAVAFTARAGGGVYLAYCVPSKTAGCTHLDLWKAGARHALAVPGSAGGHAMLAAVAAAPHGRLWVLWYDTARNAIRMVRTSTSATGFGAVRTIPAPPKVAIFDGLQAEGSRGRLDIIALVLQSKPGASPAYWDTQLRS